MDGWMDKQTASLDKGFHVFSNTYSGKKDGQFFQPDMLLCVMFYSSYLTVKLRVQINHTDQISVCFSSLLSSGFVGGSIFPQSRISFVWAPRLPFVSSINLIGDLIFSLIRLILQSTSAQETRTSCFVWRTEQSFNKSRWCFFTSEQWPHEAQEWLNFKFHVRRHHWQIQPWRYANGKPALRQGQARGRFTFNSASSETNQFPSL